MDSFGDFIKGVSEALTGAIEAREVIAGGGEVIAGEPRSATETYDRTLTGGRRALNVNDR